MKNEKANREAIRLTVDGRGYPCRVTMGALEDFNRETGKEVSEITTNDIGTMLTFVWCCVASACRHDRVDFTMTRQDFADALTPDQVVAFNSAFMNQAPTEKKTNVSL